MVPETNDINNTNSVRKLKIQVNGAERGLNCSKSTKHKIHEMYETVERLLMINMQIKNKQF